MFIQDDSGSMGWDYMPDHVDNAYCRDNYTDGNTDAALDKCYAGDPSYFASAFNGVYYNPMVNYTPPVNADGTSKTSYNTAALWAVAPKDGYGIQSASTTNLTTSYPERVACDSSTAITSSVSCKSQLDASNAYIYPNSTYKYMKTKYGVPFYYTVTVEWCSQKNNSGADKNFGKAGTCQTKKTSTYQYVRYSGWSRKDIISTNEPFPGPSSTTRTYTEEMTNFANWYAWYRTRMQMAKTSVGQAFNDVRGTPKTGADLLADPADEDEFHARIGLTTISNTGATDGATHLDIANFDGNGATTQKGKFYARLYAINPGSYTPLRGALSKVGQIYGGKLGTDPVQYSCQRNFSILTTDGYWNTNTETSSYGPFNLTGSNVGDQDKAATKPSWDKLAKSDTLADVAYYYYHTDLRPGTCTLCKDDVPPAGSNPASAVDDVAQHQHMTTFTIGLGVDGTLTYKDGYKTSTTGDYYDIVQGTKWWPDPIANSGDERIDDLWHAAVNGRGTYFSARDPAALENGLKTALGNMGSTTGSGAAAATSNLEPTAGDDGIYIATYRTFQWDGELNAYTIALSTGVISSTATWQTTTGLQAKIAADGNSDTRKIYMNKAGTLADFTYLNMSAVEKAYFDNAETSFNQYSEWSAAQITASDGATLVNYLRGQDRNEDQDRDVSYGTYNRLYRDRAKIMGDVVHSQPIYVKTPLYNFADAGYSAFKTTNASRAPNLYVAANDGMLHAFNAADGSERWAYVPSMVLPDLWRLADKDYGNNHRFYLDGPLVITDAKISGAWKTILIGGMGAGGRGYYALDVTDPAAPSRLWDFTVADDANLGYSYGIPFVTKLTDGTWVAVVTSGYNNVSPGDGKGHVYVLNIATGAVLKDIVTTAGDATNPSGLAKLNVESASFDIDNTAIGAYGGDLLGNLWHFDLNAGTADKLAAFGSSKPITAAPEIADVDGHKVVFFGTGRYLGQDDLANKDDQTIYAIKDDGDSTTTVTSNLVQQTASGSGATRSVSKNDVDWSTKSGWYLDLIDDGERVNIDLQLYYGTLVIASTVPDASPCQPGGYSWLYQLDYKTGGYVGTSGTGNPAGTKFNSPIVGMTVAKLATGTPVIYPVTSDGQKPEPITMKMGASGSTMGTKRVLWRELTN
ncbi:MAG: PilC/PilY family type IV pilus protein [Sulfuricellaceae bacterium]|nr:PilC/PilY family type IV pilus protein [Sulfuricellaceae bacterium]